MADCYLQTITDPRKAVDTALLSGPEAGATASDSLALAIALAGGLGAEEAG